MKTNLVNRMNRYVAGAGHGLSGAKPDKVSQIAQQAAKFIKTHTN
jgi:hypothetical protein